MAPERLLVIGRIIRPRGLRGAVVVRSFEEVPALLTTGRAVILRGAGGESEVSLRDVRVLREGLAVAFRGIETREAAERLRGYDICIPRTAAPMLPGATYYHYDILGLAVETEGGGRLGEVVDIWPSAAHDLYVVRGEKGEWLLPAVRTFVLAVDLARRVIVVRPIEGLVDPETV